MTILKSWQMLGLFQWKQMFRFLRFSSVEQNTSTLTNCQPEKKDPKLLKLYDFDNIKAMLFFRLLKKQDLTLLLINQQEKENLSENELILISNKWEQIQEEYFKYKDEEEYHKFLSEQQDEFEDYGEMITIDACSLLIDFEVKYGVKIAEWEPILESIGISGSFDQIVSLIKQKRTKFKYKILSRQDENEKKANDDFYELLPLAGTHLGYHVPSDILLIEWCGILKTLKRLSDERRSNSEERNS